MKKLRKFLVVSVMVLSVIAMSGLAVAPSAQASASAGDLIKMSGLSSVYYLGADGKRYVFPNSATYFSWYPDFSGVVTIPASELQSYPLGGNVTMRAGTKLVKITTDPSVYAVTPNGVLSKIGSEAQASALYGTSWAKRVVDVPDAFFTNYTVGAALANGSVPVGSLVKNASSPAVYYYDGTNYLSVSSEAVFNSNRFDWSNVVTVSSTITAGGTPVTGSQFVNVAQNGGNGGPVVTGSGLMVSLNASTASASTIIGYSSGSGQALADLASFNFTAANDGAVTVKTLKLKRIGISADSALDAVYLYDGVTRLTDGASFSNGYVSFSSGTGLMTIAAGQTKTITVKADVKGISGNIGVAVNAASDVASTGATVSGSFPLQGNLMSMTSAEGLSVVTLATSTVATSAKAGNTNTIVWSETASVANKAVDFKYIAFKQVGSINADDLANLSLYVDGTKVGTATLNNNDLAFSLATPIRLNTNNHTIELKADVIKGSSRTFSFSLQTAANAVFTDTNYNVNVVPAAAAGVIGYAPSFTISTGTLSASNDSTFGATEIVKTATNATIARFKIKAFGEDVKINSLNINVITVGTTTIAEKINDLAIVVDGSQVGSSKSITMLAASGTNTYTPTAFGSTNLFTIPAGTEVTVEVKGTLSLLDATDLDTIKANLVSVSAQGVSSYANVATVSATSANTLNVVTGNMSVSINSAMQNLNVSKNTQKVKIGSYIVSAGSAEGVNISNLRVSFTASTTASLNDISNVYISENTTPVNPQSANDFNVTLAVAKSQSKTIDVFADLGNITDGLKIQTSLEATYKTDVTLTFGTKGPQIGQTLTFASGTLSDPTLVTNAPTSALVIGGTTPVAATYKLVANNGAAILNELTINVTTEATGTPNLVAASTITVGTVTAPVVNGTAVLSGLNITVPAGNQGLNIEVKPAYNTVTSTNQGGIDTNNRVRMNLTGMKYTVNGAQTTNSTLNVASNEMVLVAAIPTFALATDNPAGQTTGFAGGVNDMLKFTVTNGGATSMNLKQVVLKAIFASTTIAASGVKIYDANGTLLNTGGTSASSTGVAFGVAFTNDYVIAANSSATFRVTADTTVGGTGSSVRMDLADADASFAGHAAVATDKYAWNDGTINDYITGFLFKNLSLNGKPFVK